MRFLSNYYTGAASPSMGLAVASGIAVYSTTLLLHVKNLDAGLPQLQTSLNDLCHSVWAYFHLNAQMFRSLCN